MSECKYRNEGKHIVGWHGNDPIYKTNARCLGQKNMPSCDYEDVEECDIFKPVNSTNFDRIIKGTPEQLAEFIIGMMELGKDNPKYIDYKVILAALNKEADKDE